MSVDTIGDFLTIIRNGVRASKSFVVAPYSGVKHNIAQILKDEGFIGDFAVEEMDTRQALKVFLKYYEGESVIHDIQRVSTPGCRRYAGCKTGKPIIGGLGIAIMTTSKGIMTDKRAKALAVGGEVMCTVW